MSDGQIKRVAILGGGMVGWTVAAALAKGLRGLGIRIVVIDEQHAAANDFACEVTTPACVAFHQWLGISQQHLLATTGAGFLLATQFKNWSDNQQNYFMPFADHGFMLNRIGFPQYAISRSLAGKPIRYDDFSLAAMAAKAGRFCHPSATESSLFSTLNYGLSLNTGAYTEYLREFSQRVGVEQINAAVCSLKCDNQGYIESIKLARDSIAHWAGADDLVNADLFIDCSGAGTIIGKALGVDWFAPANQAPVTRVMTLSQPTNSEQAIPVHRQLQAKATGWMQEIVTQTRREQQYFYHPDFIRTEDVYAVLGINSDRASIEPIRFGRRQFFWYKNCVAIGESAVNRESLGIGQLHSVQSAVLRLLNFFPAHARVEFNPAEYNRLTHLEQDHLDDFTALHYYLAARQGSEYWQFISRLTLSDRLLHKLALFKKRGLIAFYEGETFSAGVWTSLLLGNGYWPQSVDPLVRVQDSVWIDQQLAKMKTMIQAATESMPAHEKYLVKCQCRFALSCAQGAAAH